MVCFIACSKSKSPYPCKAKLLYKGSLFKKAFKLATLKKYEVYILSAKYGLLEPEEQISPYTVTLSDFSKQKRKDWADMVNEQIKTKGLHPPFTFYTGSLYNEHFEGDKPLSGLRLGKSLQWYNKQIDTFYKKILT